jgi:phosphate:Na+ symporter
MDNTVDRLDEVSLYVLEAYAGSLDEREGKRAMEIIIHHQLEHIGDIIDKNQGRSPPRDQAEDRLSTDGAAELAAFISGFPIASGSPLACSCPGMLTKHAS